MLLAAIVDATVVVIREQTLLWAIEGDLVFMGFGGTCIDWRRWNVCNKS